MEACVAVFADLAKDANGVMVRRDYNWASALIEEIERLTPKARAESLGITRSSLKSTVIPALELAKAQEDLRKLSARASGGDSGGVGCGRKRPRSPSRGPRGYFGGGRRN